MIPILDISASDDTIDSEEENDYIREGTGHATFGSVSIIMRANGNINYVLAFKTKTNIDSMQLPWELWEYIG